MQWLIEDKLPRKLLVVTSNEINNRIETYNLNNREGISQWRDYLSTLKPISTENADDMPLQVIEIDCSIEEYAARYNLVSFDELMKRINLIIDKADGDVRKTD